MKNINFTLGILLQLCQSLLVVALAPLLTGWVTSAAPGCKTVPGPA